MHGFLATKAICIALLQLSFVARDVHVTKFWQYAHP